MLASSSTSQPSIKPLFTLQHSSSSQSTKGNGVTSICFLTHTQDQFINNSPQEECHHTSSIPVRAQHHSQTSDDSSSDIHDSSASSSDSDSDSSLQFKSKRIGAVRDLENLKLHSSTINAQSTLSFDNTFIASTHANGKAYIWDLSKRRVIKTLEDEEGPGLALGRLCTGTAANGILFHQRRNAAGSISIIDNEYNLVQRIECRSQTFCKATGCSDSDHQRNLLLTPSEHPSFAQLFDLRTGGGRSIGVIHGAKLDQLDSSKWNTEGMLMSLKLCEWNSANQYFVGCGMESGKVFFHDLRMLSGNRKANEMWQFETKKDVIDSISCAVSLGKDPVLSLDMCQSLDEGEGAAYKHDNQRSFVAISGVAADAMELLAAPEKDRSTVAVMKVTCVKDEERTRMKARVRAKVGTCMISNDISSDGKPGVGICKFRPDRKVFAVGGWDKRIRIFSRTSAKLLSVLKGPNEGSISSLDWIYKNGEYVLGAASGDGKISLWRNYS
jgi:WD40 repeat protein